MIRVEVTGAGPCSGLLLLPPKTAARWQAVGRRLACHQLVLLAETLLQLAEKYCRQGTPLEDYLSETSPAAQPCSNGDDKTESQSGNDPIPVSSAPATGRRCERSGAAGTVTGSLLCDLRSADYHHQRSEVTWGHGAVSGPREGSQVAANQLISPMEESLSEAEPAEARRSSVVTANRPEGAPWRETSVGHVISDAGASRDHVTTNTTVTRDYAALQCVVSRDCVVAPLSASRDQQVSVIFNVESLERTSNHAMSAETQPTSGRAPTTARTHPPQGPSSEHGETIAVGVRDSDRGAVHGDSVSQPSLAGISGDFERRRPPVRPTGLTRPCVLRRGRAICSTDGLPIDDAAVGSIEDATCQAIAGGRDKDAFGGVNNEDNEKVTRSLHKSSIPNSIIQEDCDHSTNTLRNQESAKNHFQSTSQTADVPNEPTTQIAAPVETSLEKMSPLSLCSDCDTEHSLSSCPLQNPICWIQDSPGGNAAETLPACLRLDGSTIRAGPDGLAAYTLFGPLVGRRIVPEQLGESLNLRHIWEVYGEGVFLDTSDPAASSWFHLLRPAGRRSQRTLAVVTRQRRLFAVTTCHLVAGDELTYWQDDSETAWRGKNMMKTRCGGCNVTFEHPLFYRRHCSLFHEPGTPLTIRKYYCKVCGESVMGRQKLLRHTTEKHEGAGAYQCQHCGKFFRRQSYLELHRNHGCAANPQRSHPLCHLCGARFSQPQKLKTHIRRVHSDVDPSAVDCRCDRCGRLLGCRTALRRHLREVHLSPEQAQSALSCRRCGKQFQNGSNLKIHMLTHSGVKPFRCSIVDCGSAFTTKQCLQQHYSRVHLLTGSSMPSITRAVPYTLRGYSGQLAEPPPPPLTTSRRRPLCRADRLRFTDFSVSRDLPEPSSGPRLLQDASRSELDSIEPSLILGTAGAAGPGRETEM